jgi:hypothetical protein
VLSEKLIVAHLVKKYMNFYETRRWKTVPTRATIVSHMSQMNPTDAFQNCILFSAIIRLVRQVTT